MKIIQALGWYFPDSVGGTETYVAGLTRSLRAAGHDVRIAVPDPTIAAPRLTQYDAVPVFRYPIPEHATRDEAQGRVLVRGAEQLHAWFARERADVVHVHTFVTGLGLHELRAARQSGARVIATTHSSSLGFLCQRGTLMRFGDTLCDARVDLRTCAACALRHAGMSPRVAEAVADVPLELSRVAGAIRGRVGTALGMPALIAWNVARQRDLWTLVDRFVVLTAWARGVLVENGAPPDRVTVNRLGVRGRTGGAPRAARIDRPLRVGYVGRFDPIKGLDDLADAVATLPPAMPISVEFRGPAAGPVERGLRDRLRVRFAGDPRVSIGDTVPPDQVARLLQTYDVVCCPSRCLEGGPTIALEAMAAGTPVIAVTPGGAAEAITDGVNGALIDAGAVRALRGLLERLIHERAILDRWRAALPPVRTIDDVARDYLALYGAADRVPVTVA